MGIWQWCQFSATFGRISRRTPTALPLSARALATHRRTLVAKKRDAMGQARAYRATACVLKFFYKYFILHIITIELYTLLLYIYTITYYYILLRICAAQLKICVTFKAFKALQIILIYIS